MLNSDSQFGLHPHAIRIVLADPDDVTRRVYEAALLHEGFDVVAVGNAVECVQCMRDYPPDVLVLDLPLLWGGGDGVLAIMAEEAELTRVPVLVHTACRDPLIWRAIGPLRISDFQLKPTTPEALSGRIFSLIHLQRACYGETATADLDRLRQPSVMRCR